MSKPLRFNAFQMNTVGHQSPGLWTHPRDRSSQYNDPDHWIALARLLERGRFDGVFLADVLGVYDVYQGNADAALRHGVQVPVNDPLALVPLMAQATEHLGFGVTCALTYEHPYPFARRMSTLDHLARGRVGWNIVTGYLDSAARNLGLSSQLAHDDRYDLADEYLDVVYKLWEHSWEDDAVQRDKAGRVFTDPAKVHEIQHRGEHYRVPGIHLCEPSPQRTPVLYQAGTSSRGKAFAARHAECVFVSGPTAAVVRKYVDGIRDALAAQGRPRDSVLIYAQALVITGETEQAARAKHDDLRQHVNVEASLALLSGWTGVDFSRFAPDSTIEYVDTEAGRTALASFSQADPSRRWTVGDAARFIGLGGRGPVFTGSAVQVADELEAFAEQTGADGFNLTYALAHETMRDVVELVVPELQRRGRYPRGYTPGTLREKFNTLNILKGAGHLEEKLKPPGVTVRWQEFATGPVLFEALNAGAIDFGHAADTPSVFAQAAGVNLTYLAAEQPYPQGIAVLVPQDSAMKTIADLKGKRVAVGRGWNVQYLLVRALEDAGLSFDDIQPAWVNNAADARTAFESGRVDAVGLWDPFLAGAQLSGNPRVLRNGEGLSNNRTFYVAAPAFAAANAPVLRTVFAELRQTNDWADRNPQAVADQLAPQLGVPPAVLRLATGRRRYTAVAVDAGIVAEQQRIADTFFKLKLIPRQIQVRDAVFKDVLV